VKSGSTYHEMFLDLSQESLQLYRHDHLHIHQENRVIVFHHSLTVDNLTPLQNGVLKYAFSKGVRDLIYRNQKLYDLAGNQLDATRKIGKGTYGEVVWLVYFNVVAKLSEDLRAHLIELATYGLIQVAYPEPEKVGLPRLLAHSHGCLIIPHYGEELGLCRDDLVLDRVAVALHSLHCLGIIHRDLKPANILYNKGNPIIVDFGLAAWHVSSRFREGDTSIQSMYYRAPEVCLRSKNISYPCDWWSYGVILASRKKHLFTPSKNGELRECLRYLFGLSQLSRSELSLRLHPEYVPEKAKPFLCLNPQKRGGLKVSDADLLSHLPVAKLLHTHSIKTSRYLLGEVRSWMAYFAATEYCARASPSLSAKLAGFLFDRETVSELPRTELFSHIYELNTYTLLMLKHGKRVWYLRPCLILSLRGSKFPHRDQAQWVENAFFKNLDGTFPEIEKLYQSNMLLFPQFQLPEQLSTYFEDM
jgi:hypothetical protein